MDALLYLFASGLAYFGGLGLLLVAVARQRKALGVVGLVIAAATSVPTPLAIAVPGLLLLAAWLRTGREHRLARPIAATLGALTVAAMAAEAVHLRMPEAAPGRPLVVIGDSITAGMRRDEPVWPRVLGSHRPVVSLAEAGATTGDALERQLPRVPADATLVLVEIGGNDLLLSRRTADDLARDLDALLAALVRPGRVVYLLELPLPPLHHRFGAIQRRLARTHGVRLVPRRLFARVLFTPGSRSDGLHLSDAGHRRMAAAIRAVIDGL